MFQTEQQAQAASWAEDVSKLLTKLGTDFAGLRESFKKDLAGQAGEIARLRDDVSAQRANWRGRFDAAVAQARGGAEYRGPFASAEVAQQTGQFFIALLRGDQAAVVRLQRAWAQAGLFAPAQAAGIGGVETAGVSPLTGPAGGFLQTEQMVAGIVNNVEKFGVFESECNVVPVSSETARIIKRTGGVSVTHPDILEAGAESSGPTFGAVKPVTALYQAYVPVDRALAKDNLAIPLANFVAMEMARAFAEAVDTYAFIGAGTSEHARVTGVFNTASDNDVTGASTVDTFAELIALSSTLLAQLLGGIPQWADMDGNLKWYMHRSIFFGYLGLRDSQNRPLANMFAGPDGLQMSLMGAPVRITQVAPKLSETAVSSPMLAAANLRAGWVLVRHTDGLEFRASEEFRLTSNELSLVAIVRQGIANVDSAAQGRLITAAS